MKLLCPPSRRSPPRFFADIFQLSTLPAVPRQLSQCCPPCEFLSASSPPPSVLLSLPLYHLSPSLCLLLLSVLSILSICLSFCHLWITSLPLAFFFFEQFGYFSLCCHPSFSLVFSLLYDGFICWLLLLFHGLCTQPFTYEIHCFASAAGFMYCISQLPLHHSFSIMSYHHCCS